MAPKSKNHTPFPYTPLHIDYINPEQTLPRPERFFKIPPKINKSDVPIKILLKK